MKVRAVILKADVVDMEGRLFTAECLREMAERIDAFVYDEESACLLVDVDVMRDRVMSFCRETGEFSVRNRMGRLPS